MRVPRDDGHDDSTPSRWLGAVMLMTFALGVLAFLVVVDRPAWSDATPTRGAAAGAMAVAAQAQSQAS